MNAEFATIFVVDDDDSVRRSLARVLQSASWNVESYASGRELMQRLPLSKTGCVILDVSMPEMSGPALHERMFESGVTLPVIFLTGHGDVPTGVDAIKRGAVDFLIKPIDDRKLLATIEVALNLNAIAQTHERQRQGIQEKLIRLSPREREVMEYVIGGCLNKQIAAELHIAEKTVKVHRGQVMHKLELHSVADLVRLCESVGIHARHHDRAVKVRGGLSAAMTVVDRDF